MLFLLCAVFILFQVIFPAASVVGSASRDLKLEKEKLASYTSSISTLQKTDESQLTADVNQATSALPSSKDIEAVYFALTTSASKAGVILSGFSVNVGDVFGKDETPSREIGIPSIKLNIQLRGANAESLLLFTNALQDMNPLSKVISADFSEGSGDMKVLFYYKPYDLTKINKDVIKPLTVLQKKTLTSLPAL